MVNTIHFNTGRLYASLGQRITATLHDDGVVTFYDHDRGVDGQFTLHDDEFNQRTIMQRYDHYEAAGTGRSWRDAFIIGGCNTRYAKENRT